MKVKSLVRSLRSSSYAFGRGLRIREPTKPETPTGCIDACQYHEIMHSNRECIEAFRGVALATREEETSNDVDDVAAGEVTNSPPRKVAGDRPNPMHDEAVHHKVPKEEEDQHRKKLHAISELDRGDASAVAEGKRARGMVFRR
jgi:sRNA-binding protein